MSKKLYLNGLDDAEQKLKAIGEMNKTIPTHLELCKDLESELKEICND